MKVHVVNHRLDGVVVHRVGCRDVARLHKLGLVNTDWTVDVPEGMAPVDAVVADLNEGFGWPYEGEDAAPPWTPGDVKMLPCTLKGA